MGWRSTWNPPPEDEGLPLFGARRAVSGVKLIVLANAAVFIVDWLSAAALHLPEGLLTLFGALRASNVWLVYPLITYQFLHAGLLHIFFNMLVLWMLGRHIERHVGTRSFIYMYLACGVAGGLGQVGFDVLLAQWFGPAMMARGVVGASGAVMGVLTAFAVLYPREELFLFIYFLPVPIQARWLALGYFTIESVAAAQTFLAAAQGSQAGRVAHAAHVGGMILGFLWMKWGSIASARGARRGPRREHAAWRTREEEQAELDRILQKVHDLGVDSLTPAEKLFLQEMGDKYRGGP